MIRRIDRLIVKRETYDEMLKMNMKTSILGSFLFILLNKRYKPPYSLTYANGIKIIQVCKLK